MKGKPKAAGVAVASSGTDTTSTANTTEATSGNAPTSPPRTLADGRRLIESAYNLAERMLQQIVFVDCCRSSLRSTQSFGFFPDEDDASKLLERWDRIRRQSNQELTEAFDALNKLKIEADALFPAVWPLLDYSAAELKSFETNGMTYRHALGCLLFGQYYRAESLYHQVKAIYSQKQIKPLDPRLAAAYERIEQDTMPNGLQDKLWSRLTEERSRLARDLPAYLSYISAESPAETVGNVDESDGELNQTKLDKIATLKPSERKAYLAAKHAEKMKGCQLPDPEAWEYLNEHGIGRDGGELEDYTPPKRETFCDYMNRARRKLNEKRYTPRAGRAGTSRSIVKRSEI